MTGSIGYECDLVSVTAPVRLWTKSIKRVANCFDNSDIGPLGPPANHVAVADLALFKHGLQRPNMIVHIKPVAHIVAGAIDRQIFTGQAFDDHQRDQLFREVERTVIVGAICNQYWQAIGVVPCPYEVVRTGLARRIG